MELLIIKQISGRIQNTTRAVQVSPYPTYVEGSDGSGEECTLFSNGSLLNIHPVDIQNIGQASKTYSGYPNPEEEDGDFIGDAGSESGKEPDVHLK